MNGYVDYESNNSGGSWWLEDEDWYALEDAGWNVRWLCVAPEDRRYLGALAKSARRYGLPLEDAIEEWEEITFKDSTNAGCPCCGPPHSFTEYDGNGEYITSGPKHDYAALWLCMNQGIDDPL